MHVNHKNESQVILFCRDMASRVALVMAPLLPGIRMGVGNNGLENGGGGSSGGRNLAPSVKLGV